MDSENVNEVRWHIGPRFFIGKLHNLLRFCVNCKIFTNHALSEMILLGGELGITFDVGSRVQKYIMRTSTPLPPPPNIAGKKLSNGEDDL